MVSVKFFYVITVILISSSNGILTIVRRKQDSPRYVGAATHHILHIPRQPDSSAGYSGHVSHANRAPGNGLKSDAPPPGHIAAPGESNSRRPYTTAGKSSEITNNRSGRTNKDQVEQLSSDRYTASVRASRLASVGSINLSRDKYRDSEEANSISITSTVSPRLNDQQGPYVTRRSSYRVTEDHEYHADDLDTYGGPYPARHEPPHAHSSTKDVTTAIKTLDRFLAGVLNDDGYNSPLHPPPNPILDLVLSRYGRYAFGGRHPRVYSYMTVNNIHNNKPFGQYKIESDEEPTNSVYE